MPVPVPDEIGLAAPAPDGGGLYFRPSTAIAVKNHGEQIRGGARSAPTGAQSLDLTPPPLLFGAGNYTGDGEPIVKTSNSARGHWSEVLNFHGSPAPWILIGILVVAGMLHLSAEGKFGFGGRV
jgi:hypothetical protein